MCGCCSSSLYKISIESSENDKLIRLNELILDVLFYWHVENKHLQLALSLLVSIRKTQALFSLFVNKRNRIVERQKFFEQSSPRKLLEDENRILQKINIYLKHEIKMLFEGLALNESTLAVFINTFEHNVVNQTLLNEVFSSYKKIINKSSSESREIARLGQGKEMNDTDLTVVSNFRKSVLRRVERLREHLKDFSLIEDKDIRDTESSQAY